MKVADIRVQGRATQGVRVINLEKRNDVIASVCCVTSENEEALEEEVKQFEEGNAVESAQGVLEFGAEDNASASDSETETETNETE